MIITFTNVIGAIRNAISSVITTNLKMWLGFETSETLGREEVVNGDFATDSDWSEGAGWDIDLVNNKATCDGTQTTNSNLSQVVYTPGKVYKTIITVDSVDAGSLGIFTGTPNSQLTITEADTYTIITEASTSDTIYIQANEFFEGSITNVSVKLLTQITPDKSGNNNVGELFTGKAIEFDGINDYVEVPNSTSLNVGTDDFTYCFWVYIGSVKAQRIIDKRDAKGFTFYVDQFNVLILELNDGTGYTFFTLGTLTPSVWQRVVISADRNGNAICYINGVAQTPVDISSKSGDLTDTTSLFIGADAPSGATLHFDGFITDIQWYDTILSQSDVTYDYANPNKLAIDNPSTSLVVTNLKGYWALSEGDGLVAYDSGTNLEEEEVTNGDFATDSDWNKNSNWSISGGLAIADGTTNGDINQGTTLATLGNSYTITYEVVSISQGSFFFKFGGVAGTLRDEIGIYTEVIQAINTNRLYIDSSNNAIGSVDNVSVREVTASDHGGLINGATYVDAQPRIPQLGMMNWSKGSNLLPYSEDFTQWNVSGGTITPNFALAPNGTQTATKYNIDGQYRVFLYTLNLSTSTEYTFSFYAKNISSTVATYRVYDVTNSANVLQTSYLSELSTTDWTRIDVTFNTTSTGTSYNLYLMSGLGTGDILFWGAQLEESSSADAYRLTDGALTLNSTVIANPTIPTQDIFGNAVRDRLNSFNLDGTGYAEVADDASINPTTEITVQCWIQSNTESDRGLVAKWKNPSPKDYMLYKLTSNFRFYIGGNFGTSNTIPTSGWVNIAGTYDGSNIKTYINGVLSTTTALTGSIPNNSNTLDIGRYNEANGTPYSERISDVLLYDTALDADEIENNYNAGLSAHTN